jgi:hypothetical protein
MAFQGDAIGRVATHRRHGVTGLLWAGLVR